jgi:hypothetical protein
MEAIVKLLWLDENVLGFDSGSELGFNYHSEP